MPEKAQSMLFLNVDVDVEGDLGIAEMITALGGKVILLHQTDVSASFELNRTHDSVHACLDALTSTIEGLPSEARTMWDGLRRRTANIGVQAGTHPHSATVAISPGTVAALAAIACGVAFTVYPPAATAESFSAAVPS